MFFNFIALVALSCTASVQAVGRAIVTNQCDEPIYLWSVGGSIGPQNTITKDTSYSETFHRDPASGGIALKITNYEDGLFKPNASQTIFSYNLDVNQIWYDMSDVFGDGFAGRTLSLKLTDSSCEEIVWGSGKPPAGSQTHAEIMLLMIQEYAARIVLEAITVLRHPREIWGVVAVTIEYVDIESIYVRANNNKIGARIDNRYAFKTIFVE
ncbi:Nn.00g107560.m01.CDS01 [Neocucurbitaria sp. VM-36]